jgi:glyoxylase-like metal-dependent hydrolase (beta-lactamase superfamily II)
MTDDVYELYAIRYATNPRRRRVENVMWVAPDDPHDAPMPMDFFIWAAVSPARTVVIDTGADERTCAARGHQFLRCPTDGLGQIGIDASDVQQVITTHLHWDHAGNLGSFPAAQLHVQRTELAHASGPCMARAFLRRPYDPEQVAAYLRRVYAGRVTFHDGDEEIVPGLSIHAVGGHTPGMQVVRVNTRRGRVVLTSDAAHYYENLDAENPFPVLVSTIDYVEALHRLRDLADGRDHLVAGHDPLVLASYPPSRPELAGVVARLDVDPARSTQTVPA